MVNLFAQIQKEQLFLALSFSYYRICQINATFQIGSQQFIIYKKSQMQETEVRDRNQTSMFESLLREVQMDSNTFDFTDKVDFLRLEPSSPKENSLKSINSSPRCWAFEQQESFQPVIQQMMDFLTLQQNKQLSRIQASRLDQQSKVSKYLSHHRIRTRQDSDTSRQKQLKDNLNLSPRKKKRIDKQRIDKQKVRIPKYKLQ